MPFALVKGDKDFDTSEDWQNKVGFMENPHRLLQLVELSLFMTHRAYLFRSRGTKSGATKGLRYILPGSVTVKIDPLTGEMRFVRPVAGAPREFEPVKDIVYFFPPDPETEIGPGENSRARAMLSAAGVLYYTDKGLTRYAKSGFVKPTILGVKGVLTPETRKELETVWDRFLRGLDRLTKVFNADAVTPTVIGDGLGEMKGGLSGLTDVMQRDILTAAGMPSSILMPDAANYATAQVDYMVWAKNTLLPEAGIITEGLNEQVFGPIGLRWEFRPEMDEAFQEEEVTRASAFATYVQTLSPHPQARSIAARIVGIDLPPDVEYDDLDAVPEEPAEPEVVEVEPKEPEPKEPEPVRAEVTYSQGRELDAWQRVALKSLAKSGDPLERVFNCKSLADDQAERVRSLLATATDEAAVKAAFAEVKATGWVEEAEAPEPATPEPVKVADPLLDEAIATLRDAVAALKAEPALVVNNYLPQPVTNVAAPPPADVRVDVAAPSVTVEPPAVTVDAPVTVNVPETPPATVSVKPAKRVRVKRNNDGRIDGLEVE